MTGPMRGFDPAELRVPGEPVPTQAEQADLLIAARELESAASATQAIRPTEGFEDRVMAAIPLEPAPRVVIRPGSAVRGGRPAAFLLAIRDAWGIATTGGRPWAIRGQALAFLLLVVVAAGSLTTAAGVGVVALLRTNQSPAPSVQPRSDSRADPDRDAEPDDGSDGDTGSDRNAGTDRNTGARRVHRPEGHERSEHHQSRSDARNGDAATDRDASRDPHAQADTDTATDRNAAADPDASPDADAWGNGRPRRWKGGRWGRERRRRGLGPRFERRLRARLTRTRSGGHASRVIVVVGSPVGRVEAGAVRAAGTPARIALAAAGADRSVQLIGRIGTTRPLTRSWSTSRGAAWATSPPPRRLARDAARTLGGRSRGPRRLARTDARAHGRRSADGRGRCRPRELVI